MLHQRNLQKNPPCPPPISINFEKVEPPSPFMKGRGVRTINAITQKRIITGEDTQLQRSCSNNLCDGKPLPFSRELYCDDIHSVREVLICTES